VSFLPSPKRCLSEFQRILPILAENQCNKLLLYVHESSVKIQRPPSKNLEAFVTYLLNLKVIKHIALYSIQPSTDFSTFNRSKSMIKFHKKTKMHMKLLCTSNYYMNPDTKSLSKVRFYLIYVTQNTVHSRHQSIPAWLVEMQRYEKTPLH